MSKLTTSVIIPAAILGIIPEYQSHKVVRAGKITGIGPQDETGKIDIYMGMPGCTDAGAQCSAEWQEKHKPQVGGYLVIYQDGYISYSPAEPFESGYTALPPKDPTTYLDRLKAEAKELEERLEKLTAFLSIPDADRKPEQTPRSDEMDMLHDQCALMQSLLDVLKGRLRIHEA